MCGKSLAASNFNFVDYYLVVVWVLIGPIIGYIHFYLDVLVIDLVKILEEIFG